MKRRGFIKRSSAFALLASLRPADLMIETRKTMKEARPHICIFSKHLQWLGFREMAELASRIGFSGIDLTVREGGHVPPERVKRDLPEAVRQIRDAGMEVPMITTAITDAGDPHTPDIIETAGRLGIRQYRTGWFPYDAGMSVAETLDHARKQLGELQKINEANHIAASYQNHAGGYVGSSGWDLLRIIEGLDPEWVGVQFDIRHATVEGPETWPYIMELLGPSIKSIDIKDFTWETEEEPGIINVPLGKGMVNFSLFFRKLEELGIEADFSLHCEYPLGGAEHGDTALTISEEAFTESVRKDLEFLKAMAWK
jgi:sugar phosphate isomerase/epimerase